MLFNEPKLLKWSFVVPVLYFSRVSVLFNEPKLLKSKPAKSAQVEHQCFSALQRAEIAEMYADKAFVAVRNNSFSALQRAEIAEIKFRTEARQSPVCGFSALQRAEIAEITNPTEPPRLTSAVSVLFNEPKLLKSCVLG